jgi:hypothetical protein
MVVIDAEKRAGDGVSMTVFFTEKFNSLQGPNIRGLGVIW